MLEEPAPEFIDLEDVNKRIENGDAKEYPGTYQLINGDAEKYSGRTRVIEGRVELEEEEAPEMKTEYFGSRIPFRTSIRGIKTYAEALMKNGGVLVCFDDPETLSGPSRDPSIALSPEAEKTYRELTPEFKKASDANAAAAVALNSIEDELIDTVEGINPKSVGYDLKELMSIGNEKYRSDVAEAAVEEWNPQETLSERIGVYEKLQEVPEYLKSF